MELDDKIRRINGWRAAFCDETVGIHKAVQDLLWNYAAFNTTVRIVRLSEARKDAVAAPNKMLFNLISEGYWSSLLLGVRRLLDKDPLKGAKGVYSIRSVVNDVKNCRTWLNRKIYVERVLNAEYDTQRLYREMHEELRAGEGPGSIDPTLVRSIIAHGYFDELSGVSPSSRSSNDLIKPDIFERIEARLTTLDKIVKYVSTHIAHAGNKESRTNKTLEVFNMRDAKDTVKQLKETSSLVGVLFANEGSTNLATFLGDQFDGLDHPLVNDSEIRNLQDNWQIIDREIAGWNIDIRTL